MRVKICGITNLEDAFAAIEAGADALGFVFYEHSLRYITPQEARRIARALPPFVERVGLFVNKSAEEIDAICRYTHMGLAQIHFEADPFLYESLKTKHIKVVRARAAQDVLKFEGEYRLVDAFVEGYGGKGERLNLEWFKGVDCSKIVLAGGLNPSNVAETKRFNFYGLDVSSGVEAFVGKKDHAKMAEFIRKAKSL